jgi:tetratricopeptide (TPR) repeat protein
MRWALALLLALQLPFHAPKAKPDRREAIAHTDAAVDRYFGNLIHDAKRELLAAIEADPRYIEAHLSLGRVLLELRDYEQAQSEFERARELVFAERAAAHDGDGPLHGQLDELRGQVNYDLGRLHLELADERDLSRTERRARLRAAAEALTEASLSNDPYAAYVGPMRRDYRAHHLLGRAFDQLDEPTEADFSYRACIEIQAHYPPCYVDLARLHLDYGMPERALAILEVATRVMPKSGELRLALAELHLAQGRAEQALAAADEAAAFDPELVGVDFVRGMAQAQLGDDEKGADTLVRYLNRAGTHPASPIAVDVLQRYLGPSAK